MNQVYRALSDPSRRKILQLLRERDRTAGELAEHFDVTKPTLSRHFAVLREAGLVWSTRQGTSVTYSLNVSLLEEALLGMLEAFHIDPERERHE